MAKKIRLWVAMYRATCSGMRAQRIAAQLAALAAEVGKTDGLLDLERLGYLLHDQFRSAIRRIPRGDWRELMAIQVVLVLEACGLCRVDDFDLDQS